MHITDELWTAILAHADTKLVAPASVGVLDSFEAKWNLVLPASYREFLLRGNGGFVGYVRLFGMGRSDDLDLAKKLIEMRAHIESAADGPVLPFASDWGGSYFCFDLRAAKASHDYPVLLWNHEYSEEPADRPLLWSEFASNFCAFASKVIV